MIRVIRQGWDQLSIYLPVVLMGLLALGTWWLVRNAPMPQLPAIDRPVKHQPDYFMKSFSVKTFDAQAACKVRCKVTRHATTPTPTRWRSTRSACAPSASMAGSPWPPPTGP